MNNEVIPTPYRVWFLWIDGLLTITGILGNAFQPTEMLKSYSVKPTLPPTTETKVLTDIMAGFFAMTMVLNGYLLRARPNDLTVWRAVEFGIMLVDISMLAAWAKAFAREDRTNPGDWRFYDWCNVVVTGLCTVVRLSFCLGVRMKDRKGKKDL